MAGQYPSGLAGSNNSSPEARRYPYGYPVFVVGIGPGLAAKHPKLKRFLGLCQGATIIHEPMINQVRLSLSIIESKYRLATFW